MPYKKELGYDPDDYIVLSHEGIDLKVGVKNFGLMGKPCLTHFFHKGDWYKRTQTGVIPIDMAGGICSVQEYEMMQGRPEIPVNKSIVYMTRYENILISWAKGHLKATPEEVYCELYALNPEHVKPEMAAKQLASQIDRLLTKCKDPGYELRKLIFDTPSYGPEDEKFFERILGQLKSRLSMLVIKDTTFEVIDKL